MYVRVWQSLQFYFVPKQPYHQIHNRYMCRIRDYFCLSRVETFCNIKGPLTGPMNTHEKYLIFTLYPTVVRLSVFDCPSTRVCSPKRGTRILLKRCCKRKQIYFKLCLSARKCFVNGILRKRIYVEKEWFRKRGAIFVVCTYMYVDTLYGIVQFNLLGYLLKSYKGRDFYFTLGHLPCEFPLAKYN